MAKKTLKPAKPEQQHHYYASSLYGWGTGQTRAEAVRTAARYAGQSIMKLAAKSPEGGLFVESHKVLLPESATYTINSYRPEFITVDGKPTTERVPRDQSEYREHRVVNMKGHVLITD